MNWRVLLFLLLSPTAFAGESDDAVARGRAARADGLPQAAIYGLRRVIAAEPRNQAALVELGRCLVESDREAEAVDLLSKTPLRDDPDVVFWRAQALAQKKDYAKALADYAKAISLNSSQREAAMLGRARMLEALGRFGDAGDAYASISEDSALYASAQLAIAELLIRQNRRDDAARILSRLRTEEPGEEELKDYLLGRLALQSDDAGRARKIFDELSPKNDLLAAGAAIGAADALARKKEIGKAESLLESFITENPENPMLADVFAKLDQVRALEKDPSNAALKTWENDGDHPARAAYASYYLARSDERQDRGERAIRNYTQFIKDHPAHPLKVAGAMRLARLLLAARQTAAALAVLPDDSSVADRADRAKLRFLRAMALYQSRDFAGAAKTFVAAVNLDTALAESSLTNAALAAIAGDNEPQAAEILSALRKENPQAARRIELAEAFQSARDGTPDAGEQLAWIADRGGAVGERARLALSEWRWLAGDASDARREFRRVANSQAAERGDQKDYFAVYLADDGSAAAVDAVSEAARAYLAANDDTPREADVRMKWGEVLMRAGDFRGARQQFEDAARTTKDASLRQSAWFFAARAAIGSMNPAEIDAAIQLLEDVAQEKSEPLATHARIEQAMLQNALGRPKDGLAILDSLAAAVRTQPRVRIAVGLKKGETLLSMGATDKAKIDAAIGEWRAVAADRDVLPAERNEALTRAAAASAHKGDTDAALAAYYEVLTAPRDSQPEYFWYYKAGSDAAQILESAKRYKEAAAIYEKMAAAPGPRADEFKERLKRLRLVNFIWEN